MGFSMPSEVANSCKNAPVVASKREKNITLELEVTSDLPEAIHSDPSRLRQIITNLVGNAIKFTETGGVRVALSIEGRVPLQAQLVIDVIDSGVGMPANKLDTIFDPFTQADTSVTRQFGGTGLGLTISRKFAQALGGDITVQSTLGQGSTFTVRIETGSLEGVTWLEPQAILAASAALEADEQTHWQFPAARILVVDDGDANRELVSLVLEEAGLEVEGAENGQVGVDKALQTAFDIILMDMQMPVMDGQTATRHLRQQGIEVPIIALTAHAMKGFEQEVMAAGCSGYLTKPIDIDGLLQVLADLLGGQRVSREAVETEPLSPPSPHSSDPIPEQLAALETPIVSRLAANPRFHPIIEKFVTRLHEQLEAMATAWDNRDLAELASLSHWLKGAGGTVGFDDFTEPASNLEQLAKAALAGGDETHIEDTIIELRQLASRVVISTDDPTESDVSVMST